MGNGTHAPDKIDDEAVLLSVDGHFYSADDLVDVFVKYSGISEKLLNQKVLSTLRLGNLVDYDGWIDEDDDRFWTNPLETRPPHALLHTKVYCLYGVGKEIYFGDGDGAISLLSLGFMCVYGWTSKIFNSAGSTVMSRGHKTVYATNTAQTSMPKFCNLTFQMHS